MRTAPEARYYQIAINCAPDLRADFRFTFRLRCRGTALRPSGTFSSPLLPRTTARSALDLPRECSEATASLAATLAVRPRWCVSAVPKSTTPFPNTRRRAATRDMPLRAKYYRPATELQSHCSSPIFAPSVTYENEDAFFVNFSYTVFSSHKNPNLFSIFDILSLIMGRQEEN